MARSAKPARLALAAAALVGAGALPPVQARVKALAVLAETLGLGLPRPFAATVLETQTHLAGAAGDLYAPLRPAPGIVLLHGAAPKGKDDPRLVRLATALARAGRTVFVPALRLAGRTFTTADIDTIVAAIQGLAAHTGAPVVVLGISYGGSFGLIAAADERVADKVALVATFGAYFDLLGLLQAASTGASTVAGDTIPWQAHPRAKEVLRRAALELVSPSERAGLERAFAGGDTDGLAAEARAVYELVTNEDPAATAALAAALGPRARAMLRSFSPSAVAARLSAPVAALHSTDDPVTPYAEVLRLQAALPAARVVLVELFEHVDFEARSLVRAVPALFHTWRFASWVLAAQE